MREHKCICLSKKEPSMFCVNVAPEAWTWWTSSHSNQRQRQGRGVQTQSAYSPDCSGATQWEVDESKHGMWREKKYAEMAFSKKKWCLTKFGWPPGLSHSHKSPRVCRPQPATAAGKPWYSPSLCLSPSHAVAFFPFSIPHSPYMS